MSKEYGMLALPSSYSYSSGSYMMRGWEFTVSRKLLATGARVYCPSNSSMQIDLWDADTRTRLRQTWIDSKTNEWREGNFTAVELVPGKHYIITGGTAYIYYTTAGNTAQYNSKVTYVKGWSGSSSSFPANGYNGYQWPFIDVILETKLYKTSGDAIVSVNDYKVAGNDALEWTTTEPTGTSVAFYTSVNQGAWQSIQNGGSIQGLPQVGQTCNLRIKAELTTTTPTATPVVNKIRITYDENKKALLLTTNVPNYSSAIGDVTVSYDGLGNLRGYGGPTAAFGEDFTPTGLTWKGHQNNEEHVEVNASATVTLTEITWLNAQSEAEHVEVSASATVTLTDIHDL